MTALFPILVGLLELGAAIVYALHHEWLLALAWACYCVAAVALGLASLP